LLEKQFFILSDFVYVPRFSYFWRKSHTLRFKNISNIQQNRKLQRIERLNIGWWTDWEALV